MNTNNIFYTDLNLSVFDDDIQWINVNEDAINFSIYNILMTSPGERLLDPHFGVGIEKLLFENVDSSFMEYMKTNIEYQIDEYETRVKFLGVDISFGEDQSNKLNITVYYEIKQTKISDTLIIILERRI